MHGFKKYRLGELIGPLTEGGVLAATAFVIGSGLLLLAVEDVWVDGERLEGVGVTPMIEVQAGAASAGSDDPPTEPCCRGSVRDLIRASVSFAKQRQCEMVIWKRGSVRRRRLLSVHIA
ncbi:hypothetical protein [Bradyrhizobium sp. NAS80.1]|uniref:hypothetical protein n=1 Tax=Bradyrhizobium sp. NAS80.1 TaxID=1680159 RepID=UPI0009FD3F22|nr:hypothetical protein [Bradyrhizobium sp. NAS80.1]